MDFYRDPKNADFKHIKPYADFIYDWEVYPVIQDKNGVVLSLPPVINGKHTEMSKDTRNVFIDVTASDLTKARIVLNQLVCLFSEYSETKFSIETVEVEYENGNHYTSPDLSNKTIEVKVDNLNRLLGLNQSVEEIQKSLYKMQLESDYKKESNSLVVYIPPTRADIIHEVDIVEDLAISYGYNNLEKIAPPVNTIGSEQAINKLSDLLRYEICGAGYTEIMTLALCCKDEASTLLNHENIDDICVTLANPKTIEFQICRINLLTGLLKTIQNNKAIKMKDGLKLFEISDVVLKDKSRDTGCRNERRCIACYMGPTAGLEIIHGLIDRIMELLNIKSHVKGNEENEKENDHYYLRGYDDAMYFKGRSAEIILEKSDKSSIVLGSMGIIHPQVLSNFDLVYPCSVMEINIEPFV